MIASIPGTYLPLLADCWARHAVSVYDLVTNTWLSTQKLRYGCFGIEKTYQDMLRCCETGPLCTFEYTLAYPRMSFSEQMCL